MRLLGRSNIDDIAIGSAVLGTGGGGDPYLGKLGAQREIDVRGPVKLVDVDELSDDTLVVLPGGIGAPVTFLERITLLDELEAAFHVLAAYLGRPIGALMSVEIGGVNSVLPLALGARLGLPVIDGDGMGRAYPEGQLVTLTLYGHKATPMAMADEHGNSLIIEAIDNVWMERLARPVAVDMGAIAGACAFPITAGDLKVAAILGTVSLAERIGVAIREAHRVHSDAVQAVVDTAGGFRIFTGRIVDVERRITRGWSMGETKLVGVGESAGREATIRFQNEYLVVIENDEVIVSVPDLIVLLDSERGEPITVEHLRYGFRVTVIGIPCDGKWRTPEGIDLGGPRHFGYDIDFTPVETRFDRRH